MASSRPTECCRHSLQSRKSKNVNSAPLVQAPSLASFKDSPLTSIPRQGRTGLIISAYMVYAGIQKDAPTALRFFGEKRTHNGKGVTIPSQMRFVHYFEQSLRFGDLPQCTYQLRVVRMSSVPDFDVVSEVQLAQALFVLPTEMRRREVAVIHISKFA